MKCWALDILDTYLCIFELYWPKGTINGHKNSECLSFKVASECECQAFAKHWTVYFIGITQTFKKKTGI